jgi:hypothetical protein
MNDEIKPEKFLGQAYTPRIGRHLPYGTLINFKGIIVQVMTEEDHTDP